MKYVPENVEKKVVFGVGMGVALAPKERQHRSSSPHHPSKYKCFWQDENTEIRPRGNKNLQPLTDADFTGFLEACWNARQEVPTSMPMRSARKAEPHWSVYGHPVGTRSP